MTTNTKGTVRTALLAFIKQAERAFNAIPKSRGGVMLGTAIIGDTQYNLDRDMNEVRNRTGAAIAALREALSAEQKGWMSRVRPSITEASQHFGYTNNRYIRNYVSHYADMAALAAKFNALYNGLRNLSMQLGSYSRGEETPGVLSVGAKATSQSNMRQIAQLLDTPIRDLNTLLPDVYDLELMRHYQTLGHAIGELQFWRSRLNGGLPVTQHQLVSPVLGYLANQIQNVREVAEGNGGKQLHIAAMLRRTKTRVAQIEDMMARMEHQGKSVGQPGDGDGVMSATAKAFRKSKPSTKGVQGSLNQIAQLLDAPIRGMQSIMQDLNNLGADHRQAKARASNVLMFMRTWQKALRNGQLQNVMGSPSIVALMDRLISETQQPSTVVGSRLIIPKVVAIVEREQGKMRQIASMIMRVVSQERQRLMREGGDDLLGVS